MNARLKERKRQAYRDKRFLKELGKELREQNNLCTAKPLYWGIMDYEWREDTYTPERIMAYSSEDGKKYETVEEFIEEIYEDNEESEELDLLIPEISIAWENGDYQTINDLCVDLEMGTIDFVEESQRSYIARNCMFLTRSEAERYLAGSRHHHSRDAHTYCMHAFRSPQVARLLDILEKM